MYAECIPFWHECVSVVVFFLFCFYLLVIITSICASATAIRNELEILWIFITSTDSNYEKVQCLLHFFWLQFCQRKWKVNVAVNLMLMISEASEESILSFHSSLVNFHFVTTFSIFTLSVMTEGMSNSYHQCSKQTD